MKTYQKLLNLRPLTEDEQNELNTIEAWEREELETQEEDADEVNREMFEVMEDCY